MISKETREQVREWLKNGHYSAVEIARMSGISTTSVARIAEELLQQQERLAKPPTIISPDQRSAPSWCEQCERTVRKPCVVCQLRAIGMAGGSGSRRLVPMDLDLQGDEYAAYVAVVPSAVLVDEFLQAIGQDPPDVTKRDATEAEIRKRLSFGEAAYRKASEEAREALAKRPAEYAKTNLERFGAGAG